MKRDSRDPYRAGWSAHQPPKGFFASHKKKLFIAVAVFGALAFAAGWNPPTGSVHSFTEASEYSARREAGCTNSGAGCHGEDTDLADFNRYHPEATCRDCHEYTGVGCIPCHAPAQRECTACHDGSMKGASDAVRLTDSFPNGHYRDSLHEAVGTDMKQVVLSAAGGKAQATCSSCHSKDLKTAHTGVPEVEGSRYGAEVGCTECHNDEQSGALKQVLSDWKRHRCADCHGDKARAPMHAVDVISGVKATGEAGCGDTGAGCHDLDDLHALHPDAPQSCGGSATDGEPACHDLEVQADRPTATGCGTGEGTCHATYLNERYSHENDASVHSAPSQGSAVLVDGATGIRVTCGACHSMELAAEHARPGSSLGSGCGRCHNRNGTTTRAVKDSWPDRTGRNACATCHRGKHRATGTAHLATQLNAQGNPAGNSCVAAGCHPSADVRVVHAGVGCAFAGCHSARGNIKGAAVMSCGGTDAQTGTSCHTGGSVHAAAKHVATEFSSANVATPGSCAKSGCHTSTSVDSLHAKKGCALSACHAGAGPSGIMGCGGTDPSRSCHLRNISYHTRNPNHHIGVEYNADNVAAPGTCVTAGCHETNRLSTLHTKVGGCYGTAGCHVKDGPSMVIGCGGSNGALSCHLLANLHEVGPAAHNAVEYASRNATPPNIPGQPGGCTAAGCHGTVDVRQVHGGVGCFLSSCHGGTPKTPLGCGGVGGYPATACHNRATVDYPDTYHLESATLHTGLELGNDGLPQAGACYCHNNPSPSASYGATDVRRLPDPTPDTPTTANAHSCYGTAGCHTPGGPGIMTCGGSEGGALACHSSAVQRSASCVIPDRVGPTSFVWRTTHEQPEAADDPLPSPDAASEMTATPPAVTAGD